jgi:multicomponent Na+:H+ antiporter subunit F
MIAIILHLAFALLTGAVALALYRLARGPTVIDRILAFDTIASCAVGMIVLLAIQQRTAVYLELILIFSLLGFVGAVAFAHYLSQTGDLADVEEPARADTPPSNPGGSE